MKKAIKSIFFPHVAIIVIITIMSALSLIYSLIKLPPNHYISIFSYIMSAYSLSLIICAIINFILKILKNEAKENQEKKTIAQVKINLILYGTFFYNSIYAIFTLLLGLFHKSSWYMSIAAYYISLAIMRFSLLNYSRTNKAGTDLHSELKRFRFCGILLIILNTALSGLTFYQTIENREFKHHGATAITLVFFTISLFALSIINIIKYKKSNSPVLFAAKLISFVSALVSMLSLETAIISKLENMMSENAQKIITGVSAFSVLAIIGYIGIFMIIKGNKSLKLLKKSQQGTEVKK